MNTCISIRRPLSPDGQWIEVSLYRAYADMAYGHLTTGRYFEAILISCIGYDVLVNSLPDRLRLHHYSKLSPQQQQVIDKIEKGDRLTAGGIVRMLEPAKILHWRLQRAFQQFNQYRNRVIHVVEKQTKSRKDGSTYAVLSLKADAIIPYQATQEDAKHYFRGFCHLIDLSGGESPRVHEKMQRIYSLSKIIQQRQEKRRQAQLARETSGAESSECAQDGV